MNYDQNQDLLYEGKAKKVFATKKADQLRLFFKDDLTAFNAQKKGSFQGKGALNRDLASLFFSFLAANKVKSHHVSDMGLTEMIVQKLQMIPLEAVVRNFMAGSFAKKMGRDEGEKLAFPIVEFYFKDDALNDPFLSDEQILVLGIEKAAVVEQIKVKTLQINSLLRDLFSQAGFDLIDFKIEWGRNAKAELILGDEISPDSCRIWDQKTHEKFDKDRFRRDLGGVEEAYAEVYRRLKSVRENQS